MGVLLFLCLSAFLILFMLNNPAAVILASPMAIGLGVVTLVADLYLLRSLLRDWTQKNS